MTKRYDILDLYKFVLAVILMLYHSCFIGVASQYYVPDTWIYVEYFYIISGYFIFLHFQKKADKLVTLDLGIKNALGYTFAKMKSFWPYTIVAIVLNYLNPMVFKGAGETYPKMAYFSEMLNEILFIPCSLSGTAHRTLQLWFLSSFIIVLPLFATLCQFKHKYLTLLISIYVPLIYYGGGHGFDMSADFPICLFRAFCSLSIGICVYFICEKVNKWEFLREHSILATGADIILLFATVVIGLRALPRLAIVLFIVFLSLLLSGNTYLSRIEIPIFRTLGKLSMVLYITHWTVGNWIRFLFPDLDVQFRMILYYICTFLLSIVMILIVDGAKKDWIK